MQKNTFSHILLALLVVIMAMSAQAAPPAEKSEPVNTENVEDLIKTLESQTAREELIADLKVLIEAREKKQEPLPKVTDVLKIEEITQAWKKSYVRFLETHGLNASLVGYLIVSGVLLLATVLLLVFTKKSIALTYNRLTPWMSQYNLSHARISLYMTVLRLCIYAIILMVAVSALAVLLDFEIDDWIPPYVQLLLLQTVLSVLAIFLIGAFIVEAANYAIERFIKRKLAHRRARMNTLLPIARTILVFTLVTLFAMTLLSQLGLNIAPLLAGAGVLGLAIGFGAQALIKDVLTGFAIILEDLIQVGDVATLGGKTGLVEKISMRAVQLRDLAGTIYTVPFSEVTIVENLTKDFSYYLMDIAVALKENTDHVVALLRQIDEEMRQEEAYKERMLEPIDVLGVERFEESAVIIRARLKTPPLEQWSIGREYNRRMKLLFDEQGIEIPLPHRTLYFGENKEGKAAPVRVKLPDNLISNIKG